MFLCLLIDNRFCRLNILHKYDNVVCATVFNAIITECNITSHTFVSSSSVCLSSVNCSSAVKCWRFNSSVSPWKYTDDRRCCKPVSILYACKT